MDPKRNSASHVDAYVRAKNSKLQAVAKGLRALVKAAAPQLKEGVNPWGLPMFDSSGPFGYFMIGKSHVTFGLYAGTSLDDPEQLLEGTGKSLRHVKLRSVEDLKRSGLRKLVKSAVRFNRDHPPEATRKQKESVVRASDEELFVLRGRV
ncbi:MAG TPA: DUF1801 domain-containing protein [Candidatus Acidoferrales bacterium]|nr:DUF1801 domain-containing protein [Candidatus Acidoferrales bacterium]